MARGKPTITRDSVFGRRPRGEAGDAVAPPTPAQGIAPQDSPTHQTAVWLGDDETEWLDSTCQRIKRGGWRSVTRSALIRALVRAAKERQPDLAGISGEVELIQRLTSDS